MTPYHATVYVLSAVVFLSFLSLAIGSGSGTQSSAKMRTILSNASQSCAAARQDTNPVMGIIHAERGASMAESVRKLVGEEAIRRQCGIDVSELVQICEDNRRRSLRRLRKVAPNVAVRGDLGFYT
jgi:hypothetical protein